MKKVYIAVVAVLFLLCLVLGGGWLTTKWDLEASQIIAKNLKAENEQYTLALNEANRRIEATNQRILSHIEIANEQISLRNATIANLEKKLKEEQNFGAYWWERAHPKWFKSLDELKAWLEKDDSNSTIYIYCDDLSCPCLTEYDCDDYAIALMTNALLDGYSISLQIEGDHVVNSTIIGNDIYFIEPQTDKVWFVCYRD